MYKVYFFTYTITIIMYLLFFVLIATKQLRYRMNSTFFCILNDILFYLNLVVYIIIINSMFQDHKLIYIILGTFISILLRCLLIRYGCHYFSRYFGYSLISRECNDVFYNLLNDDDNILTRIYSKYGPIINNINYEPRGYHDNSAHETYTNFDTIKSFLFDTIKINKIKEVTDYFELINVTYDGKIINKIIELLDRKYLIAKFIWNIILITILFCLSLKYI